MSVWRSPKGNPLVSRKSGKRLYLIGIDSAPLWLLKELSREGGMEIFRELIKRREIIELQSTLPPMTYAAWPTIYTGLSPAEHGVPDFFLIKRDYITDFAHYDAEKAPPFWRELANKGVKSLVITPAVNTDLPSYGNIDIITGFPFKARTNNLYLGSLMNKYNFYGEPEDIEKRLKASRMTEKEASRRFAASINKRAAIARESLEHGDYNFAYICFTETDRLQHFVMNKRNREEYLLPIYQGINAFLKYLIERAEREEAAIVIVSDHGAQPIREKFLVNAWLIREGYATLKDSVIAGMHSKKHTFPYNLRERAIRSELRKLYDRLPHPVKGIISRSLEVGLPIGGSEEYTRLHLFDFDMSRTKAFAAISNLNVSTIWINDGRFQKGVVKEGERERIKRELIDRIKGIKNRNNDKVIANVFDGSEYYKGAKFLAPDLLIEARSGYSLDIFNFSSRRLFMRPEPPKRGDHTMNGILGFYPEYLSATFGSISIYDIAPAILSYFGIGWKNGGINKHKNIKDAIV